MTITIDGNIEYILIVTGDIDGNGKITVTDLARAKLHLIETEKLDGFELEAADLNNDGKITITDIAQIKLVLIDLLEIK